jgi:predicted dehydrogenase
VSESNALIKLGIVGCGEHSHEHFKAAKEVQSIKITTCCDIQDVRSRACAEKYGCDKYYTSLEEMLEEEKLDGVILCTWPIQHLEQIELCLKKGVKNILCEKSLTLSSQEAIAIGKLVQQNDAFLMEGCKYLHHPAIRKLERILSYGDIGKIDSIRATFSNYEPEEVTDNNNEIDWRYRKDCGGGVAYDWMSYLVNACNHFSGSLPKRVFASGTQSKKYDVFTRIFGMIEYENGVVAFIESSKEANFSEELQITCANGILRLPIAWGIFGETKITQTHRKPEWDYILTDSYEIEESNAFVLQLKNFAAVIQGVEQPRLPLYQSIQNVQLIEAMVTSCIEGRIIEF